jgi:DNA-binding CsgD family transcriptional regulator/tetratricopeptide (TPR) repeat protein
LAAVSSAPPLPGPLSRGSAHPFVGRDRELRMLLGLLGGLENGRQIALVGGEAGSGKSRLVREFARAANDAGVYVLYGACDPVVRTAYRPFVEAIGTHARTAAPDELRHDGGRAAAELTRLVPELRELLGPPETASAGDQDAERFRLHGAVADLLTALGRRRPLLVVLEDGHWADTPTLLLLQHLARATADARVLLLATFRDTEAEVPDALADTLAELRRPGDVVRIRLRGLSHAAIAEFVDRTTGTPGVGVSLADPLERLTHGNPFLVCELWQSLTEAGAVKVANGRLRVLQPLDEIATPDSVREVVSQRLARLDDATVQLLELGATAGSEFAWQLASRAAQLDDTDLLAAVEQAVRSGMLEEMPGRALSYRFTHELVRRALYDRLGSHRRAALHLRVSEALEALHPHRPASVYGELAHHLSAAIPLAPARRAVAYHLLAARAAAASLAFEEAATHLQHALELGIDDATQRAEAQLDLGMARHCAGAAPEAISAYAAAAETARGLEDRGLLARAAVGLEEAAWRPRILDDAVVDLLEEAEAALPGGDSKLRVGLLTSLSRAHALRGRAPQSSAFLRAAVAMARRVGDQRTLAATLAESVHAQGAERYEDILAMLTEAYTLAEQLGELAIQAVAGNFRGIVLLALGRLRDAERELAGHHELVLRNRQPFMLFVCDYVQAAIALSTGRLADAETYANRVLEWGRHLRGGDAAAAHGILMFSILREQGRLQPVAALLASGVGVGAWPAGAAALYAEVGLDRDARRELAAARNAGLAALGEAPLPSLVFLADAAVLVGDVEAARFLYPALLRYAGSNIVLGQGIASFGAGDRYLGTLAAVSGATDAAVAHLEAAVALNRSMGADTWLAHSSYELGRLSAVTGDEARAAVMLSEATVLARRIGMPTLIERIGAVTTPPVAATHPDGLTVREATILRLVAEGQSNRAIGRTLRISEHTVANHVRSILRKTGCANRTQAAARAQRSGMAGP